MGRGTKTFTCYKLLSRMHDPFLCVDPSVALDLLRAVRLERESCRDLVQAHEQRGARGARDEISEQII